MIYVLDKLIYVILQIFCSNRTYFCDMGKINRIKAVLVDQGRSGRWLANQLDTTETTVSRWCTNDMQPSLEKLVEIAKILGVNTKDLIN